MLQTLIKQQNKPILIPVPYHEQETEFTCGPAALKMVMQYHGDCIGERRLRKYTKTTSTLGTNHQKLITASRKLGYHCFVKQNARPHEVKYFINKGFPTIINWQEPDTSDGHYSVIFGYERDYFYVHDPYSPHRKIMKIKALLPLWHDGGQQRWFMVTSKEKIPVVLRGKTYQPL